MSREKIAISRSQAIRIAVQQNSMNTAILLAVQQIFKKRNKKKYNKKRWWVHPIFQLRRQYGFADALLPTLRQYDEKHHNYMRMTTTQFDELLRLVGPSITKKYVFREPISPTGRLAQTLRYLATGDQMSSSTFIYLVGLTTTSNIISKTCEAIWECLHQQVLPSSLDERDWLRIADGFEKKWNFNHCIGAIDGKHIRIQCPDNAGSEFNNYKHYHSIVLLATCDYQYLFTLIDLGAHGRRSDGGVFRESSIGQRFNNKQMNLPPPKKLTVDGSLLPYMLVGDEAFQLTDYMLRPYPRKSGLTDEKRIFNYRLSRARRMIEDTFGIMVSKWQLLKRPIEATVRNSISMMKAIICLHNWLRKQKLAEEDNSDDEDDLNDDEDIDSSLQDIGCYGSNNSSTIAMAIRDEFCDFFNCEGAVPWQYDI